ncbi:hypothetical protein PR048_027305 [Dryococelus australis]|uniref:Uncharacterized protein n=1 Tax=Dryococelus australis TaxID=614101 RepID=A0ABQ9GGB8_9NEOP|nr:hypothetical protein PR048_027305 [Dryococelus australis]
MQVCGDALSTARMQVCGDALSTARMQVFGDALSTARMQVCGDALPTARMQVLFLASHPRRTGFDSRRCRSRIFACGNRTGRCRWSASFLGDLSFPHALLFRRCSILHLASPSPTLRATQISALQSHHFERSCVGMVLATVGDSRCEERSGPGYLCYINRGYPCSPPTHVRSFATRTGGERRRELKRPRGDKQSLQAVPSPRSDETRLLPLWEYDKVAEDFPKARHVAPGVSGNRLRVVGLSIPRYSRFLLPHDTLPPPTSWTVKGVGNRPQPLSHPRNILADPPRAIPDSRLAPSTLALRNEQLGGWTRGERGADVRTAAYWSGALAAAHFPRRRKTQPPGRDVTTHLGIFTGDGKLREAPAADLLNIIDTTPAYEGTGHGFPYVLETLSPTTPRIFASGNRARFSHFPRPFIPALLHTHLASPSSAPKTSLLRAAQISSLATSE